MNSEMAYFFSSPQFSRRRDEEKILTHSYKYVHVENNLYFGFSFGTFTYFVSHCLHCYENAVFWFH